MQHRLTILLAITILFSCNNDKKTDNGVNIKINPENVKEEIVLSDLSDEIEIIKLQMPDSILFGEIAQIKSNDDYLFLLDENQTKSITIFDKQGQFMGQLKKLGQGPGEYTNIFAFSPNRENKKLYIYDRNKKDILVYTIPNLKFIEKIDINKYLMTFEVLKNNLLLVSDDNSGRIGHYIGYGYFPLTNKIFNKINLPDEISTIELAYAQTFSWNNNKLICAVNSEYSVLYEINDDSSKMIAKIDFGKYRIPKKYWKIDKAVEFSNQAINSATFVHNSIISDSCISFFYIYRLNINSMPKSFQLCIYDKKTNECKNYNKILLSENCANIPNPIGVDESCYLSLIYSHQIKELIPDNAYESKPHYLRKLMDKSNSKDDVFLLKFKL